MAARTAVVVGTANAVSGSQAAKAQTSADARAFQDIQQQQAMQQAAAAAVAAQQPVAAAAPADDLLSKLTQLGTLRSQGILSEDEFTSAKAKLLA